MRKYIVLIATLFYILIAVWKLYYAYAPKIGPIGNGPNEQKIWLDFALSMIGGAFFIGLTILMFRKDKKK